MRKPTIYTLTLLVFPILLSAQPKIQLEDWAAGFRNPVDISHCGDSRIFVTEKDGVIKVLDSLGNLLDTLLDIDPIVNSVANERGLLGLAFHPDYATNGYFFVHYSSSNGSTQVSRFSVDANSPNKADPTSELSIFSTSQPFNNHNGGCIKFGADGYLYIGMGDGGSGGDPQGNGQKKNTFLGKMLRIDVNNSSIDTPYVVPADNPFVGQAEYLPEIWSTGWRNPWRFSFDRLTGDMWVGDVGQVTREEVDFEPAGMGGLNYGWRCYEGTLAHNTSNCDPQSSYVGPVFDYDNSSMGCSITGGFIYRGSKYPDLYGEYLNADYCSGRIWATRRHDDGTFSTDEIVNLGNFEFSSFGEGMDGELYITLYATGKVQRITELCSSFQVTAGTVNSPVCTNSYEGTIELDLTNGNNVSFAWSDGQATQNAVNLNPGTYTVTVVNGNGCSRVQSYEIAQQGPNQPILVSNDYLLCAGQSAALTASGLSIPNQLKWYNGNTLVDSTTSSEPNYTISVTEAGTYFVFAIDSFCSVISETATIEIELPLNPGIIQSNDTLFSNPVCNACQWLLNGQPLPDGMGTYHVASQTGSYSLEVTSDNGCSYESAPVQVVISAVALPVFVETFNLVPNPSSDSMHLTLEFAKRMQCTIMLQDANQRQIFMQTHNNKSISLPMNLGALPAGTYYLTVQTASGSFVKKVLKL